MCYFQFDSTNFITLFLITKDPALTDQQPGSAQATLDRLRKSRMSRMRLFVHCAKPHGKFEI
jgi:hypothetical protein